MQRADYARARDFIRLDAGSGWTRSVEASILLREGKREAAFALIRSDDIAGARLLIFDGPKAERDRLAVEAEAGATSDRDPENKWYEAAHLAFAGYRDAALRLLRKAVEDNYLCHQAIEKDPLFDSIREEPEFAAIRAESIRRQKEFLARRATTP
jgi:hypothetical protein